MGLTSPPLALTALIKYSKQDLNTLLTLVERITQPKHLIELRVKAGKQSKLLTGGSVSLEVEVEVGSLTHSLARSPACPTQTRCHVAVVQTVMVRVDFDLLASLARQRQARQHDTIHNVLEYLLVNLRH